MRISMFDKQFPSSTIHRRKTRHKRQDSGGYANYS